jgi:quaternary ammonium compound-resistance protein SugE
MNTYWYLLIIAGFFEVVWALGLKYSDGLSKTTPALITIIFMCLSAYLLAVASRQIPIGISYTIWVGIGAVGTFIGGALLFDEEITLLQSAFFCIIVVGIVGLKLATVR